MFIFLQRLIELAPRKIFWNFLLHVELDGPYSMGHIDDLNTWRIKWLIFGLHSEYISFCHTLYQLSLLHVFDELLLGSFWKILDRKLGNHPRLIGNQNCDNILIKWKNIAPLRIEPVVCQKLNFVRTLIIDCSESNPQCCSRIKTY